MAPARYCIVASKKYSAHGQLFRPLRAALKNAKSTGRATKSEKKGKERKLKIEFAD
jgi:hypothetical protein